MQQKNAKKFYEQGKQYFNAGDYTRAVEIWENALSLGFNQEEIKRKIEAAIGKRKEKDFKRADEIRDELTLLGIVIEDTPEGTIWRKN